MTPGSWPSRWCPGASTSLFDSSGKKAVALVPVATWPLFRDAGKKPVALVPRGRWLVLRVVVVDPWV